MTLRIALALLILVIPAAARSQDHGATVGGSVSVANMQSHTDLAFAGTFGYRFTRVFGIEIEATAVPDLSSPFGDNYPVILAASEFAARVLPAGSVTSGSLSSDIVSAVTQIYPGPTLGNPGGRLVVFTNNARIEIPTMTTRVTPYFVAGGGIASERRTAEYTYQVPSPLLPGSSPVTVQLRPIAQQVTSSSTALALTLGGGVGIRVVSQLSVDVDLRLFRLLGQQDRNVGRFGVGVRYRF